MTGYIRSSDSNYYIEPAENFTSGNMDTILHRIKQLPHVVGKDTNEVLDLGELEANYVTNGNHTIIEDDFPAEIVERRSQKHHSVGKRDIFFDDSGSDDVIYDVRESAEEIYRTTREVDYDVGYNRGSREYFVKVLVVADKAMVEYHKTTEELTRYILILMSHVALLFKEPSIGNAINIAVVHIRILKEIDFTNLLSHEMLSKFCEWQQKHVTDRTHDVALLLTRHTICKDSWSCNTLGVAQVNSMCSPSGCTIVRDKGLSTSYTIAHELGHVMSMPHDEGTDCEPHNNGKPKTNSIMSMTQAKNDSKPFTWSSCSKHYVTDFLDSSKAKCVQYPPINNQIFSNFTYMLPGDSFEVDSQCELEFGPGYSICPLETSGEPPCGHLWCINSRGECRSQLSPWAEGTKCGPRSWCYRRQCISDDRRSFVPIDGGWGPWQEWGPCSRTCGGGIRKSIRYCDSPRPENGGSYCLGESTQYSSCNVQDCDENAKEFRAIQCAEFNGITKNIPNLTNDTEWVPKYGLGSAKNPDDYCRLYCRPQNSNAYYMLKDKAVDGTKCGKSGFDICVSGTCRPGGCDNQLDSKRALDECGVCGGDNSSCQEITGTYNSSADQVGYNRVVRIPKGSSNLNIRQRSHGNDENFLALIDGETGQYILNGNQMLNMQETDVKFDQLTIKYSGVSSETEWITTPKNQKLSKDLIVEVLSVGGLSPPDILYRYVIGKDAAPRYGWRLYQKEWSKCNSICEGVQYRKPTCVELINGNEVHSSYCDNSDVESATEKRQCNAHCELTWYIVSKGPCSPHCGKGYRRVHYNCMKISKKKQSYSEIVDEKHCNVLAKPPSSEPCSTVCNTTRWDYSSWSECSKTCGGGTQRRTAKCVDENNVSIDDSHCRNAEKIVDQMCNTEKCPVWMIADTSACSAPCGGGYANITYYCVLGGRIYDNHKCDPALKPPDSERCNERACGRWAPQDDYLPCSVTCGEGVERRYYVCKKFDSEEVLDRKYCRGLRMPREESRPCYRGECEEMDYFKITKTPHVGQFHHNAITHNSVNLFDAYKTFQWVPGDWGSCSQTCDGGTSTQNFHCRNDLGVENQLMCDLNLKPVNVIRCNDQPCPKWKVSDWSPGCDLKCERRRQVRCMDDTVKTYDDARCDIAKKPIDSTKCKLSECPHAASAIPRAYFDSNDGQDKRYKWKVGPWKQCSNSCGKGVRRRHIECEDSLNDITVVDTLCRHLRKPKAVKPCERYNCKYTWIEDNWSTCSATCGQGTKSRNVTCHKVHHGGVVDPTPLPDSYRNRILHKNYCSMFNRPPTTAKCLLSRCEDQYAWQPDPWKPCTQQCGKKGHQIRKLSCVRTKTKEKVPKHYCPKSLKPPRKRKCNQWKCLYGNCKEVKRFTGTKENRDYVISVNGRPVMVYCYKMDTPEPLEYISLHPDKMNFAEVYDKRLRSLDSCPYNGERRDSCQCDEIGTERSGMTTFYKVRLNITSLKIIGDDFTFSNQIRGRRVPYGEAGDCYSQVIGCGQGRFSVDLTSTSFKLYRHVRWNKVGQYASATITRTPTIAQGKCGGYCGNCVPDPTIGLAVEVT
ncbi:A disintegrin and metalloproteinase with thrombospondin motifs 9 isoform X2 [Cylas formicarius]|uniref:A disintegrin and metalloproteinase with thrombospondin motifs 9 isoform X2 n=1 Tax=Cylas formicarius TaxID=197179 RepID=UPI0029586892|nr:A disintegrin and metalloproteinase with thrombospondin motifs 9 isoform X2 [Cylas formicarius]